MEKLVCAVLAIAVLHRASATKTEQNEGRARYITGANNNQVEYEVTAPERVSKSGNPHPHHKHFIQYGHSGKRTGTLYYKLAAFGRDFQFQLEQDNSFVSPSLTVEHVFSDERRLPFAGDLLHCFYSGQVQGDPLSIAVFNLCNGMRGSFLTKGQRYFVEPAAEDKVNTTRDFRKYHIVYRHATLERGSRINGTSTCGLKETNNPMLQARGRQPHPVNETARSRRKRRGIDEAFVETMVVADKTMVEAFPSKADLQSYIITLMGVVAQVYRERSIGNPINIVLVKIVLLESDEPSLHISTNAARTLRSFCRWQKKVMTKEKTHPEHHDTAILITRRDICRQPGKCDTLGLAELGTMCLESKSCALAEDSGLSTAYTISHELGHVFNLPHDGDNNECSRGSGRQHLMAPSLSFDTKPWSWSSCSRDKLTDFLDLGYGACLADKPHEKAKIKFFDTLPGELYSANKQCQMIFGDKSSLCSFMEPCRRLWCVKKIGNRKGCSTHHMPWADGTPCSKNRWCIRGQCVKKRKLKPVDGNWGQWAPYDECTRTCGGGISFSHRQCNNPTPENGGRFCVGSRKRFKSCNTQSCPKNSLDFRYEQCARKDGRSLKSYKSTRWLPKYAGIRRENQCKLYCRMAGTAIYFKLNDKVIDGTPCNQETSDICVDGKCLPAGCDSVLYSEAKYDRCGVCKGDSSSCRRFSGTFNETSFGYNYIFTIPVGATDIVITQNGWKNTEDESFLALQSEGGSYLLNGAMTIQLGVREFRAAGANIWYSGSKEPFEQIKIDGKTNEPIKVLVLEVGEKVFPPNVHYSLYEVVVGPQKFKWDKLGPWTQCSELCQGIKKRRPRCVRAVDGLIVSSSRCEAATRPSSVTEECNIGCRLRWHTQTPGKCSARCGPGYETRIVRCMRISSGQWDIVLDKHCAAVRKPPVHVPCEGTCEGTRWKYSQWSKCSKSCSGGTQARQAKCQDTFGENLKERDCRASDKQVLTRQCSSYRCPWWTAGKWGPCSVTCGSGWQQRAVKCEGEWGQVRDRACDPGTKPLTRKPCDLEKCPFWREGQWTDCSVTCGAGSMTRPVQCISGTEVNKQVSDDRCSVDTKPEPRKDCKTQKCTSNLYVVPGTKAVDYHWRLSLWTPCSVTCGEKSGRQQRDVECVHVTPGKQVMVDENHCEHTPKPVDSKVCSVLPCTSWKHGSWGRCSHPCGRGFQFRVVKCTYDDWKITEDKNCDLSQRPLKRKICQIKPCVPTTTTPATEETTSIIRVKPITTPTTKPPRELPTWTVDRWSECSVSCGQGFREREVQCRLNSGENSNECDEAARPPSTMACTRRACPDWRKGPWSACSMSCGEGIRRRDVICKFDNGESSSGCDEKNKPAFREACHVRPCPRWIMEDWNRCSVTCGQGVKQRLVQCGDKDVSCDASTKPQATASCNLASCPKWTTGEWDECSVSCGNGMKTRAVECDGKNAICDSRTKPEATARCNLRSCPQWKTGEWRECSVSCGNGFKRRTVECDGENTRCDSRTKPEATARCNLRSCPQWKTGEWRECSVTCGDGFKRRSVTCEALNARCDARTKPGTIARCKLGSCPEWKTGKWSQCSTTCGNGVRERTVECSDASAKCNPRNKPQTTWRCNMRSCAEWTAGKWSQCSVTCGNGYKRRSATCDTKNGRCDRRSRPVTIARCNDGACPRWTIGRWSKCSVTCGNGFITRAVECSRSDAKCVARIKPTPTLRCNAGSCPEWRTGRWSKCSVTCGSGSKARTVQCSQTRRACDVTKKPEATASCNPASCPKWETGEWSECSVTCGNGSKQRTVECGGKSGCDPESKPETTARCAPGSCPQWTAGQWTKCSVSCGNGSRQRIVQCDGSSGSCDPKTKPTEKDRCNVGVCPQWKIGEWAECSVSCGNGFKERKIECITGVNATCDVRTKPVVTAKCNQGLCPRWNTGRWTQCSQTCGEGVKRRAVGCFALNSRTMLHESACDLKQKPSSNEICNTMDCVSGAKWYKGEWGKCSVYCGIGDKLRDIYCSAPNGTKVPDVYCAGDHKPKPKRSCNKRRRCGEWEFGLWSKCSLTCGKGFKTRPIRCLHQLEYKGEMYCDSKTRPLERTKCNNKACPALPDIYHWQTSGWSKCSSTCGYGKKSRDVWCVDLSRRNISSKFCKPATKPEEFSSCFEVKCPAKWKHGHWTECSKSCGRGYQYRAVECVAKLGRSQATKCDKWTKPPVWRPCNMGKCDGFVFWRVGPWSPECSVSCGVGVMRRAVRCFARNGTIVDDSRCEHPMSTKPDASRPCHMKACQPKNCKDVQTLNGVQTDGEQTLTIKGKELKVFCYAMMSKEPKEYITLKTSSDNFAEIYPKILRNSRTCPANGSHLEKCDCEEEDYKLSGGSYFSKLRIDLVAMKIIGEDQRFASTTGLNPPSYATAGDCYSAHGKCPQGRFSINLQDTGLRLTRKVMWKSTGRGYSQIIYRYPEGLQVIGKCGGKCGTCRPEANIGLQVELSQGDS